MRGKVEKDKDGNLIVVYYKECVEDSEAVVQVYCKFLPGFDRVFKVGDKIEFELEDFPLEGGGFTTLACPIIRVNPHVAKAINTNEDGEADMGAKLVDMSKTLRSKIYYRITNDGSPFGCDVAMRNAESIEELFDEYAIKFMNFVNETNSYHSGEDAFHFDGKWQNYEEILKTFKKSEGLCK